MRPENGRKLELQPELEFRSQFFKRLVPVPGGSEPLKGLSFLETGIMTTVIIIALGLSH